MKSLNAFLLSALTVASASAADFTKIKNQSVKSQVKPLAATEAINAANAVTCFYDVPYPEENRADYYVIVATSSDAAYDSNLGVATASNAWVISLDFVNDASSPVALADGTYKVIEDDGSVPAAYTLLGDYSVCQYFDESGNITKEASITGNVTVTNNDNGEYTVKTQATDVNDGTVYNVTYTGRLPFTAPSESYLIFRQIMEDRKDVEFVGGMGFYYGTSLQSSKGGEMMIQLYSDEFNEENGMQYDETTMICLNILGRPFPTVTPTIDPGTYPIVSAREIERGKAFAAREMSYIGQTMVIGTYLRERNSKKYSAQDPMAYCYLESGDIVIEESEKGYKISLENGRTNFGYEVTFHYDGPIGPIVDYSVPDENHPKSTITDDVNLKLSDLPLARVYNGGIINGTQTFLFDIGSRSGLDPQRDNGGDIIRFEFVCEPGTRIVTPGSYTVMAEKYETYYTPGSLGQSRYVPLPKGGTDMSGTIYMSFEEGRTLLVLEDLAWFLEGNVGLSMPTEGQPEGDDNRIYNVKVDLIADNNFFVKGEWTGPAKLMYDPDTVSAIGAVEADGSKASVRGAGNGIYLIADYVGQVEVFSMTGQSCGIFDASQPIDLSAMPSGLYIFKMGQTTAKIVK